MLRSKLIALAIVTLTISGCSSVTQSVTRHDNGAMTQLSTSRQDAEILRQTAALQDMTRDLVRKTTMQGAAIGAVAGCGLAAIGGSKSKCLTGALAGGAVGALAGNAAGQAQVEKRVEIVSLSRVMPSLAAADRQMAKVSTSLPDMLRAQNAELTQLDTDLAAGTITVATHAARSAEIHTTRRELVDTLSMSAKQAREAHDALQSAQAQGQQGLEWYLLKTQQLEAEAVSAREDISLI